MSKFWTFCALLLVLAVILMPAGETSSLEVKNFGSSCVYRHSGFQHVGSAGNSLQFTGAFRDGSQADPSYSYRQRQQNIVLRIDSGSSKEPLECRKMVRYEMGTSELHEGDYHLTVYHDERKVYDSVVVVG